MFDIYVDTNDNSPIKDSESLTAFIFMPEVNVADYENNPSAFRKLLKEKNGSNIKWLKNIRGLRILLFFLCCGSMRFVISTNLSCILLV